MGDKTTSQVAHELGLQRKTIIAYISRHPELVPARRLYPSKDFLWTDEEIDAYRNRPKLKGRPKKK